ncbi:CCA tRNA nucleotidyltransferase [Epibacterium ulvae]|nr:CCA tRNA nucleotidyltransferase [Epibacterium ulvae]MBT8153575.1 CCA tRNA nucleotidyltransferase [Epibacterium ulvae]
MRIEQDWLSVDTTQRVCATLQADGAQVYFVGGCVRNALLGAPVSDLDISTDAHPDAVLALAQKAGIKAIPTGIDHGTVTLVVDGVPFEVTTFRKDVATDGRRAVVAFAQNMEDDARRRDFTMNAIYADPTGALFDPLGGLPDLQARKLRFIGTAAHRIQEDFLRTLRYFRFHAWYGDPNGGMDPDALAAIAENLDGLALLSRERVTHEMLKLMAAPDPAPAVAAMRQTGVLMALFPGSDDRALAPVVHLEGEAPFPDENCDAVLRLAALGEPDVFVDYLRLSKVQEKRLTLLRNTATGTQDAAELSYRHGVRNAQAASVLRAALLESPLSVDLQDALVKGSSASFPIQASDLMPEITGPALGVALKKLEATWIDSRFQMDRDALLSALK